MQYKTVAAVYKAIAAHEQNKNMQAKGWQPVFSAHPKARVVIIGQAPGRLAQESGIPWNDPSGQQLRRWLGVSDELFYDETRIALIPMDFYFPGSGKTHDLPPRPGFAELWHPPLLELMPKLELTILIGQYAQAHYLEKRAKTLTETVKQYKSHLKQHQLPLPHPSPRNNIWKKRNPWFEKDIVPTLQREIKGLGL